ncbi:MAG: hypothetical protein O7I42_12635 [Alphaproteobacteria bacterium]|nr:hypothetical protein [Alphaproteobacteria bacterium]
MIGETSAQQAQIEVRAPSYVRAADVRAGFRSGTPGRRAQDVQAQDANAKMRVPIFDLRSTNRQAPHNSQPLETSPVPGSARVHGAIEPSTETIVEAEGLQSPATGGRDEHNPLRRLSINDAYLSAETLGGPYAHRGSIFDLQI